MGVGEETGDLTIPEPPEPLDDGEKPFEGEFYDGEADLGPIGTEEHFDDVGTGAVLASIHVEEEFNNSEDVIVYMDSMTMPKSQPDATIVKDLLKSVKDEYEARGSSVKP